MNDLNDGLLRGLREHGLDAKKDGGWIVVPGRPCALRAQARAVPSEGNGAVVRLDLDASLPDGRLLRESFGSAGRDEAEATSVCVAKVGGSLHVLLEALFGVVEKDGPERKERLLDGVAWKAYHGDFGVEASGDAAGAPPLANELLASLGTTIETLLEKGDRRAGAVHWLRLYRAQLEGKTAALEVLWDNVPWPAGAEAIAGLAWPAKPDFLAVRSFALLVRSPLDGPAVPGEDYRSLEAGVRAVVERCTEAPHTDDGRLLATIEAAGFRGRVAERFLAFTPIAFAMLFAEGLAVRGVSVPREYGLMDERGAITNRTLESEPIFVAARCVAYTVAMQSEGLAQAVARRCALGRALEEGFKKGGKPEDFVFAEPVVTFADETPEAAPEAAEPGPPPSARPWWKLWG